VAAPEDDQYNEHHHGTMGFSSFRVPQGGISDCWRIRPGRLIPRILISSPTYLAQVPGDRPPTGIRQQYQQWTRKPA
jgi:hypothetical protein